MRLLELNLFCPLKVSHFYYPKPKLLIVWIVSSIVFRLRIVVNMNNNLNNNDMDWTTRTDQIFGPPLSNFPYCPFEQATLQTASRASMLLSR